MKIRREKQAKKAMLLYQNVFGFRQPFQILLDGTILVQAERNSIDLIVRIPKTIHSECKLVITPCILNELEQLKATVSEKLKNVQNKQKGSSNDMELMKSMDAIAGALRRARKYLDIRQCPHSGKDSDHFVSAHDCVISMINKSKYCIGTQEPTLKKKLRRKPGVPIMHISNSVLLLEHPSDATIEKARQIEIQKTLPESFEKLKSDTPMSETEPIKKKKKPKAPNPLSCLKPKKKETENHREDEPLPKKKRIRSREKKSQPGGGV